MKKEQNIFTSQSNQLTKAITGFILFFLFSLPSFAQGTQKPKSNFPGVVTVKVSEEIGELDRQEGEISFGRTSLDALCAQFKINKLEKKYRFNQTMLDRQTNAPDLSRIYKLTFPEDIDVNAVVQAFSKDPNVEYAEPVAIMYEQKEPNDEFLSNCSYLQRIKAAQAWDIHHGEDGSDVVIGICDGGTEWYHPDLVDNLAQNLGEDVDGDGHVIEYIDDNWVFDPGDVNGIDDDGNGYADDFIGWNFYTGDGSQVNNPDGSIVNGHGTHVTGIAAGRTNNSLGIASISWNLKFMPTKHGVNIMAWPQGIIYNAYDGIIYLAEMGCDIINCSWGGDAYSRSDYEVLQYAESLGSIIVAAAGNSDSPFPLFYPACYPGVLSVASVDNSDLKSSFSNYGMGIDVCAPGGPVYSTIPQSNYAYGWGTSMASPVVSGLLGLMKSYYTDWTNDQLRYQLIGTCDDIDNLNPGYENMLGSGRVNAYRALTETNVTIPDELRLELVEWQPFHDENENHILEPGETAYLGLSVRNYAPYVSSDNVTFTLSVNDPDVSVLNGSFTGSLGPDSGAVNFQDIFEIQVAQNATSHIFSITVEVEADIDITFGSEFTAEAYINPESIFIWDGGQNTDTTNHFSGAYIHNYLNEQGIPCIYSTEFPMSLVGFDAVFLSFGNPGDMGNQDAPFLARDAQIVEDYLEHGGSLYLEGGRSLGYYQSDNTELLNLLGLEVVGYGGETFPLEIVGNENSVGENIVFNGNAQSPRVNIDAYDPANTGTAALTQTDFGHIAIQNEGQHGQKSICSSCALVGFKQGTCSSRRDVLLARILNFFEIPAMQANFEVSYPDGFAPHAPVTLTVNDKSVASSAITSWKWDLNNDGTFDSFEQNPTWTFQNPGYQSVYLEVSDGSKTSSYLAENFLYLFNGESALDNDYTIFSNRRTIVPASASINLSGSFTFETWIKPKDWGPIFEEELLFPIMDKGALNIVPVGEGNPENEQCICVRTYHSDGCHFAFTPSLSLQLDIWQHIAVTYDGVDELKIYIDGIEQDLVFSSAPSGPLADNSDVDLLLACAKDDDISYNAFDGAIDEVRIWNIVRTSAEINDHKDIRLEGSEDGLQAYWDMNEAIGDTIYDKTQNHNTGSLMGSTWTDGALDPVITSVDDGMSITATSAPTHLQGNTPNPFSKSTLLNFVVAETSAHVNLCIYDVKGQIIKELVNSELSTGRHSVLWDGTNANGIPVTQGIYFARLTSGGKSSNCKMILMK